MASCMGWFGGRVGVPILPPPQTSTYAEPVKCPCTVLSVAHGSFYCGCVALNRFAVAQWLCIFLL